MCALPSPPGEAWVQTDSFRVTVFQYLAWAFTVVGAGVVGAYLMFRHKADGKVSVRVMDVHETDGYGLPSPEESLDVDDEEEEA